MGVPGCRGAGRVRARARPPPHPQLFARYPRLRVNFSGTIYKYNQAAKRLEPDGDLNKPEAESE
jgi:hypothetical protein